MDEKLGFERAERDDDPRVAIVNDGALMVLEAVGNLNFQYAISSVIKALAFLIYMQGADETAPERVKQMVAGYLAKPEMAFSRLRIKENLH